jgi:hypothetical protein
MLINKQLWFSHPSKFNDPFDTQINLRDYLREIKADGSIRLEHYKADEGRMIDYTNTFIVAAEKYLPLYEDYLKTRFLYCVNQQQEGFNPFEEVLMWSHYAGEHRGICIGLSMDSVKQQLNKPSSSYSAEKAVVYGQESVVQDLANEVRGWYSPSVFRGEYLELGNVINDPLDKPKTKDNYPTMARLFNSFSFVKSKNWSYEHEYRFVLDDASNTGFGAPVTFDASDLENVVFGLLTPQSDKDTIQHLLQSAEWAHVKIWQAKRGTGIFKLEFDQIK